VTLAVFAVIFGSALAWEVLAILRPRFVTIGRVLRWLMASVAFRFALFAFWAWAGVHLFARATKV
jgi:hypothetical protein